MSWQKLWHKNISLKSKRAYMVHIVVTKIVTQKYVFKIYGFVWYMCLNKYFQFWNNIIHIFTYFFYQHIFLKNTNNIIKITLPNSRKWSYVYHITAIEDMPYPWVTQSTMRLYYTLSLPVECLSKNSRPSHQGLGRSNHLVIVVLRKTPY